MFKDLEKRIHLLESKTTVLKLTDESPKYPEELERLRQESNPKFLKELIDSFKTETTDGFPNNGGFESQQYQCMLNETLALQLEAMLLSKQIDGGDKLE